MLRTTFIQLIRTNTYYKSLYFLIQLFLPLEFSVVLTPTSYYTAETLSRHQPTHPTPHTHTRKQSCNHFEIKLHQLVMASGPSEESHAAFYVADNWFYHIYRHEPLNKQKHNCGEFIWIILALRGSSSSSSWMMGNRDLSGPRTFPVIVGAAKQNTIIIKNMSHSLWYVIWRDLVAHVYITHFQASLLWQVGEEQLKEELVRNCSLKIKKRRNCHIFSFFPPSSVVSSRGRLSSLSFVSLGWSRGSLSIIPLPICMRCSF